MKGLSVPSFSNLSHRERIIAAATLLVLCIVLLDRLVLGPWWRHTQKVREEIETLELAITSQRKLINRKQQVWSEVDTYRDYIRPPEAGAPEMAELLREVEALGEDSGMLLGEVKPLPVSPDALYHQFALEIQYEGTLKQWIRFIYLLQDSTLLFEVQRATLSAKEGEASLLEGTLRLANMTIRDELSSDDL